MFSSCFCCCTSKERKTFSIVSRLFNIFRPYSLKASLFFKTQTINLQTYCLWQTLFQTKKEMIDSPLILIFLFLMSCVATYCCLAIFRYLQHLEKILYYFEKRINYLAKTISKSEIQGPRRCTKCGNTDRLVSSYPLDKNQWSYLCAHCLRCQTCKTIFRSGNALFSHLKIMKHEKWNGHNDEQMKLHTCLIQICCYKSDDSNVFILAHSTNWLPCCDIE